MTRKKCLALCLYFHVVLADAFAPAIKTVSPSLPKNNEVDVTASCLWMAGKRGGGPRSGPASGTKTKKNSSNLKQKKKGRNLSQSSPPSRLSEMNNKKKTSSHGPPWQVVSKKDMANNLRAENERRKLAQQGVHNVEQDRVFSVSKTFLSPEDKNLLAWKRFASSPNTDEIEFIGAYLNKQLPPRIGAPEVAFLGRSNVGKSSLLNKLIGSETARVGKTPGATASVNLYGMFRKNKAILGLVDLPGFGYAKLSKESKESVQMAAENYLGKRKELMLGILLVDIRRAPSDDDRAVLAALFDQGVPIIVVATKTDKLSKIEAEKSLGVIRNGLGLPEGQPFSVSSATGHGVKDLWRIIMEACGSGVEELKNKMEQTSDKVGGNEEFEQSEEDDEVAYSQGYDWIHDDSSVMYDYDEEFHEDDADFADEEDVNKDVENLPNQRESIQYLRKKAKEMEKRGEL